MKSGRDEKAIYFGCEKEIDNFLTIDFEKYRFIDKYNAIYSINNNVIESIIIPLQGTIVSIYTKILKYKKFTEYLNRSDYPPLTIKSSDKHVVSISPCSNEIELLSSAYMSNFRHNQRYPRISIKIEGYEIDNHFTAKKILRKISNSVFFEIDLKFNIPIKLDECKQEPSHSRSAICKDVQLKYPRREFDKDALSLYWYAKSSNSMPLQTFLSFYQVLEFYFPFYLKVSAKKKVRNLLSDPSFNIDNDNDINRVLAIAELNLPDNMDERSQLCATLEECVDESELKEFFRPEEKYNFFLKKNKEITDVTIPLKDIKDNIIKSVAKRVYDIRCRIVHTKNLSETTKSLLPHSQGAKDLHQDIALLEFLAKKVIIAGSIRLEI